MCSAMGCEFCFIARHAYALTLEVEDLVEELEHIKKKAVALIASISCRQNVVFCMHIHLCRETFVQLCVYICTCVARITPNVHPHSQVRRSVANVASTVPSASAAEKNSGRSKVV